MAINAVLYRVTTDTDNTCRFQVEMRAEGRWSVIKCGIKTFARAQTIAKNYRDAEAVSP